MPKIPPKPIGTKRRADIPTDTPSKSGFRTGREQLPAGPCPYEAESPKAAEWHRLRKLGQLVKVGRNKANASPWCQCPTDCAASGSGLCRSCCMKRNHTDPAFQAKVKVNILRAGAIQRADPEKEAKQRAASAAKLKERWNDPAFVQRRLAGFKQALKDPGKRAKILGGLAKARQTPQFKETARANIKKTHNPGSWAKGRATRRAKGAEMSPSRQRKIAKAVQLTSDTYEEIGRRYGISGNYVKKLAVKYGTARPRTR